MVGARKNNMSYRNKTYIIFDADTDMRHYRMMTAWKENQHIDFNFHNAHELSNLMAWSSEETIKAKLRDRMANTKQAIVLVGENTKNLYKFVRWEMQIAFKMDIPIIAVHLDGSNQSTAKTPAFLRDNCYFVNVPFELKKIKYALDNFPDEYHTSKSEAPSARHYADWSTRI